MHFDIHIAQLKGRAWIWRQATKHYDTIST